MAKNPTGIRFNEEKVAFVMKNENLDSLQKVVSFLIDKYWWEKKIGGNPVTERNMQPQEPKTQPLPKATQTFEITFQQAMNKIPDLMYEQEFKDFWKQVQESTLITEKQKDLIKINMSKSNL